MCVFHDGNIYFDKIKRLATAKIDPENPRSYLTKEANKKRDEYQRHSKATITSKVEFIFKDYLLKLGHLKLQSNKKTGPLASTTNPT